MALRLALQQSVSKLDKMGAISSNGTEAVVAESYTPQKGFVRIGCTKR